MKRKSRVCIAAFTAMSAVLAGTSAAQAAESDEDRTKRVRITYENLTASQGFAPAAFFSHSPAAPPLFVEGKPAPFGLQEIAEDGSTGALLAGITSTLGGGAFGVATQALPVGPGGSRTVVIRVSQEHPLVTGAWMLGNTNDGFTGIQAVDAYALSEPMSMDLYAWDAGTENNNELGDFLIAMEGTERDPENGMVHRHEGIRGDADAPGVWKFDPERPVARITLTPSE